MICMPVNVFFSQMVDIHQVWINVNKAGFEIQRIFHRSSNRGINCPTNRTHVHQKELQIRYIFRYIKKSDNHWGIHWAWF